MTSQATHFKYICRVCKIDSLLVLQDVPEKTVVPAATAGVATYLRGVHHEARSRGKFITLLLNSSLTGCRRLRFFLDICLR
jgi:hypothetical protein